MINWQGINAVTSKLPMHQRATTCKFIYDWLLIQYFLHRQHRSESPTCHICNGQDSPAILKHMLSCPNQMATMQREKLWKKSYTNLKNEWTSLQFLHWWDKEIRIILGLHPPWEVVVRISQRLQHLIVEAATHQHTLSWEKILRGFISMKRKQAQRFHAVPFLGPPDSNRYVAWHYLITKQVLLVGGTIWTNWNETIHGKKEEENRRKCREAAINHNRQIYDPPLSLLCRFPKPTKEPLAIKIANPCTNY